MENTETLNSICFITRGNVVSSVTNIKAKYTYIHICITEQKLEENIQEKRHFMFENFCTKMRKIFSQFFNDMIQDGTVVSVL